MARIPRIMSDLHYISDKIAENSRNISGGKTDNLNPPEETHTPAIEPLAPEQPEKPQIQMAETANADSQDEQYLKICNGYYNNARNALSERVIILSATLEERKKRLEAEASSVNSCLAELKNIQEQLSNRIPAKPHFKTIDECNAANVALEHLQTQYARTHAAAEDNAPERNDSIPQQATSPVSGDFFAMMLKSLSFGQLSRLGCSFGFAYILALLAMGILLAAAIVGAMKGYF